MANQQAVPLSEQELRAGFTHKWVLDYDDINVVTPTTTTAVLTLYTLTLQSTLVMACAYRLDTAFDASDSSVNSLLMEIGYASNTANFMPQKELAVDGTEVKAFCTANATDTIPYFFKTGDAATTIDAKFTIAGGGSPTIGELTSGSVVVLMKIVEAGTI